MFIILLGANPLVLTLARTLGQMGHSLTCIDEDEGYLKKIQSRLDCRIIRGSPSYPDVLREADAHHADMLIAATCNDEMNMIACQVAFSLFKIPKKIACISSAHYLIRHELFGDENLPIDVFINPERLITEYIFSLMTYPGSTLLSSDNHHLCINATVEADSQVVGMSIAAFETLSKHGAIRILCLHRKEGKLDYQGETLLQTGDALLIAGDKRAIETCLKACLKDFKPRKRVLIASSDQTGEQLAKRLCPHYPVKIIDEDLERSKRLASQLPHCIVLHGDLNDEALMREENIDQIDLFCALTHDDEDNILAAVQAKYLGAKQTLLLMRHQSYAPLLGHGGIDIIISPHQLILDHVLSHCHHPWIKRFAQMPPFGDHISLTIPDALTKKTWPIQHWQNIEHTTLFALERNQEMVPLTETKTIEPGDKLSYFITHPKGIKTLNRWLSKMEKEIS